MERPGSDAGAFCVVERVMRYLLDHWRGRHSLARSFWLNSLAANGVAVIVLTAMTLLIVGPARDSPPAMLAGLVVMWSVILTLSLWQVVGTWRAADNHRRSTGRPLWPRLTQALLVILVVRGGVVAYDGGLQIHHMAKLALGRDGLWTVVARDGEGIRVTGFVTFATPGKLTEQLAATVEPARIRFDSTGGYVGPAKTLREIIQARGLDTEVVGRCESACTLAFVGGAARLAGPEAQFGFHGFTLPGVARSEIAAEEAVVKRSWLERGIQAGFVERAFAANGAGMWRPSLQEMVEANFVTHIVADGKVQDAREWCRAHDCR